MCDEKNTKKQLTINSPGVRAKLLIHIKAGKQAHEIRQLLINEFQGELEELSITPAQIEREIEIYCGLREDPKKKKDDFEY